MVITKKQRNFKPIFPFNILNKDLKLIFASNLAGSFGDGLSTYLLPYHISNNLKASSVEVGILYALSFLTAAVTVFIAGMVADRYDRKKIMIVGWIAWLPVPLIFSFANNWFQMLPGMILYGVWFGGPTRSAYIVTTADKSKLSLTSAMISSSWSFGYIFSPALGGYIAEKIGMKSVFYMSSIFYTLACLILVFIKSQQVPVYTQNSAEQQYSFLKLLRTRKLFLLSIFFGLMMHLYFY